MDETHANQGERRTAQTVTADSQDGRGSARNGRRQGDTTTSPPPGGPPGGGRADSPGRPISPDGPPRNHPLRKCSAITGHVGRLPFLVGFAALATHCQWIVVVQTRLVRDEHDRPRWSPVVERPRLAGSIEEVEQILARAGATTFQRYRGPLAEPPEGENPVYPPPYEEAAG